MNYNKEVKERWGNTEAYAEFNEKTKDYSEERIRRIGIYSFCIEDLFL